MRLSASLIRCLSGWWWFSFISHVRLFATPWITARQASLSITISRSSLSLTSIESMMPTSHLILVVPFSSCPQSLPASESFPMSQLFAWGGQSTVVSALASYDLNQIPYGYTVERVSDFILGGLQNHCRHLLLGRKVMTNLDSILKSRDITLPTKVHLIKATVFPVVMYGCESWTVKKAEYQRIDGFELWCWRRLLRVPWVARRSNQSILKEISPGCSSEGLMLKPKLQYFGHLMWRVDSLEKTLMLGGIAGRRRRGRRGWDGWMASPTQWTWVWINSGSWWWTGRPDVLQFMGSQRVGHN